jgi:hypothetical protein
MSLIDFSFTVTGGLLAGDFGGPNAQGIISVSPWLTTSPIGEWTKTYDNGDMGSGMCDVFPVPEPSSTLLFLMGGAVWSMVRRCRRNMLSV